MKILPINTKSKKYNIYIGHNLTAQLNKIIKKEKIFFKKSLLIIDKNVPKKLLKKINSKFKCETKLTFFFQFVRKK